MLVWLMGPGQVDFRRPGHPSLKGRYQFGAIKTRSLKPPCRQMSGGPPPGGQRKGSHIKVVIEEYSSSFDSVTPLTLQKARRLCARTPIARGMPLSSILRLKNRTAIWEPGANSGFRLRHPVLVASLAPPPKNVKD